MTFKFPDTSSHQSGIPTTNLPAIIVKATQGKWYTNSDYVPAKGRASKTGTFFLGYHFLEVGNGSAQADYCYQLVVKTPLMLDFEEYLSSGVLYQPKMPDAIAFIDRYRAKGGICNLVYLPQWYWKKIGSPSLQPLIDRGMKLVSSYYGVAYSDSGPGWAAYGGMTPVVWQYTSTATVNGFNPVDMNACKMTLDQFKAMVNKTVANADTVIAKAVSQLGYLEGGTTKFGVWYASLPGNSGQGFESGSWCDMFVSWVADQVGLRNVVGCFAYVPYHMAWFKAQGIWHAGTAGIQRGDVIVFDWDGGDPDHIGYVENVAADGIHTIEGNAGSPDGVYRVVRQSNVVEGYGRPKYGSGTMKPQDYVLMLGATGAPVIYLQQRLVAWKYLTAAQVDGDFGPVTDKAVRAFQLAKFGKAGVDGQVGPNTWRELDKNPITPPVASKTWQAWKTMGSYSLADFAKNVAHTDVVTLVTQTVAHYKTVDPALVKYLAGLATGTVKPTDKLVGATFWVYV